MATDPKILSRYRVQHADDPSMMHEDLARQFEAYRRAVTKGNLTALLAALQLCVDTRQPERGEALQSVPNWLLIETLKVLRPAVADGSVGKLGTGRHSNWAAKATDYQADLLRVHEVSIARSGERPIVRDGVVVGHEPALTGDAAFEEASKRLEGTFAWTTPENLKKAMQRFKKLRETEPELYFGTAIHLPEEES